MVIPQWLKHLSEDDVKTLEAKIAQVESQCDVEIVPVIVRASSNYPQTKVTVCLLLTLVFMATWDHLDMEIFWDRGVQAIVFAVLYVLGVFVLAPWLSRFGWIQMVLAHRDLEYEQCMKRADLEFHSGRVSQTKRQTGVLIYISLLEHRVIVKGDEAVFKKIESSKWQEAVTVLLAGIRKKRMAQGISDALDVMESLLKVHFPIQSNKSNELPNTFIIKE